MPRNTSKSGSYDVVVVGGGNAALTAAISAHQSGARVVVLESASNELRGGNTRFTGGLFRFTYHNLQEISRVLGKHDDPSLCEFEPYTADDFLKDINRVTRGKYDPALIDVLIKESYPTVCWLAGLGMPFGIYRVPNLRIKGTEKYKVQFGAGFEVKGKGLKLSERLFEFVEQFGIPVLYETECFGLLRDAKGSVIGVQARNGQGEIAIYAKAVVLGSGGFQSNPEMRTAYMGPAWSMVKVRGTRFDTGLMTRAALNIGAHGVGQWSGAHATPVDGDSGDYGDLESTDETNRVSYPYGLMFNLDGNRFCDEGEDFKLYTYAKTGGRILQERNGVIFQLFDQKTVPLLEKRYGTGSPETADTIEKLANQLEKRAGDLGFNKAQFLQTVAEYNVAVADTPFDAHKKDGKRTNGLAVNKSNWAQKLDAPPYVAYPVTTGITFTFGGLHINTDSQVIDVLGRAIPGLYATGEATGGFFYYNYPGGSGLTRGAVFGRRAGKHAAAYAERKPSKTVKKVVNRAKKNSSSNRGSP